MLSTALNAIRSELADKCPSLKGVHIVGVNRERFLKEALDKRLPMVGITCARVETEKLDQTGKLYRNTYPVQIWLAVDTEDLGARMLELYDLDAEITRAMSGFEIGPGYMPFVTVTGRGAEEFLEGLYMWAISLTVPEFSPDTA